MMMMVCVCVYACCVQLLHRAARHGHPRIVEVLLSRGATVSCSDDGGKTPLHDACWAADVNGLACSFAIAKLLLDQDESILRAMDNRGHTPLDYLHGAARDAWVAYLDANKDRWWAIPVAASLA